MQEELAPGSPPNSLSARFARALNEFPEHHAAIESVANDVVIPTELRAQGALARQLIAAIAPHLHSGAIRACAARIGAWAETPADLDTVARLGSLLWREGEECLASLMLDSLTPDGRWYGIDQLAPAIHTEAAATSLAMVWHALPQQR